MSRILPILFNTDMVCAILDGRKTVTRRLIKPHYRDDEAGFQVITRMNGEFVRVEKVDENECGIFADGTERHVNPQYKVGDILYVRETAMIQSMKAVGNKVKMLFAADDALAEFSVSDAEYERLSKWAHLQRFLSPYWLTKETSRIWLKVTGVRAERLQDITEEQARAEGFADKVHFIDTFLKLYPACSLETWVWVYEFERCEKPEEDAYEK